MKRVVWAAAACRCRLGMLGNNGSIAWSTRIISLVGVRIGVAVLRVGVAVAVAVSVGVLVWVGVGVLWVVGVMVGVAVGVAVVCDPERPWSRGKYSLPGPCAVSGFGQEDWWRVCRISTGMSTVKIVQEAIRGKARFISVILRGHPVKKSGNIFYYAIIVHFFTLQMDNE